MVVFIARYNMRENVNPWPEPTWTYSQALNASDVTAAGLEAIAFTNSFMPAHSASIVCYGIGIYSAPKGDKLFQFIPTDIDGQFNIGGNRLPLWNTAYTQITTVQGRVGFHHWRLGFGADNVAADNEWDGALMIDLSQAIATFISANPDVLCKPSGVLYTNTVRTDVKFHMRQFGARTPVGGRPGGARIKAVP